LDKLFKTAIKNGMVRQTLNYILMQQTVTVTDLVVEGFWDRNLGFLKKKSFAFPRETLDFGLCRCKIFSDLSLSHLFIEINLY